MNILLLLLGLWLGWWAIQMLWYLFIGICGLIGQAFVLVGTLIGGFFVVLWELLVAIFKGIWIILVLLAKGIWALLSVVIAVPVAIVEAIAVAFGVTIAKFASNIHWCSRYNKRYWWKKNHETAARNYFFGPGYAKLYNTMDMIVDDLRREANTISRPRDASDKLEWLTDHVPEFCETLAWMIYMGTGFLSIVLFGVVLGLVAVLFWGVLLTVVMLVLCVPVGLSWVVDEAGLWRRRPRSDCPVCKHHSRMPFFRCACGRIHRRLRPGPYGMLHHRCYCGKKLPCTFLSGRAKQQAVCPVCNSELAASDARPLVFHLAGGTKSGKTTYLAAFFHETEQRIANSKRLSCEKAQDPGASFAELAQWFNGAPCPETVRRSGRMYAMRINGLSVRRQLSIFDVTGNVFGGTVSTDELPQLSWCDGLLLVIDPFCGTTLKKPQNTPVSQISTETVVSHFIRHMTYAAHMKATARCTIPLTVLIAKADEPVVYNAIGPDRIEDLMFDEPDRYAGPDEAQNAVCRQFLIDIGLNAAISDLEAQFTHVRYYPVSAQGHPSNGRPFAPWGVTEAMDWMLERADKRLMKALRKNKIK